MLAKGPRGKAPTVQIESMPLAKTDKELSCWLQVEELVAEEVHQGRDTASLVVLEAAGLLADCQLKGVTYQAGNCTFLGGWASQIPWLLCFRHLWWWLLNHPTYLHLLWFSNYPQHLLQLNSHLWLLLWLNSRLYLLLWLSSLLFLLWCPL